MTAPLSRGTRGGHSAARSGAGLPAPACSVKLRQPEVPPRLPSQGEALPEAVARVGRVRPGAVLGSCWGLDLSSWAGVAGLGGARRSQAQALAAPKRRLSPATGCYPFVIRLLADCPLCARHSARLWVHSDEFSPGIRRYGERLWSLVWWSYSPELRADVN